MKKGIIATLALSAFSVAGIASAQTGSGTLGVTATVQGSIDLTFVTDASGLAVTGTGTSAASLAFGAVGMYGGTTPANVTKTVHGDIVRSVHAVRRSCGSGEFSKHGLYSERDTCRGGCHQQVVAWGGRYLGRNGIRSDCGWCIRNTSVLRTQTHGAGLRDGWFDYEHH